MSRTAHNTLPSRFQRSPPLKGSLLTDKFSRSNTKHVFQLKRSLLSLLVQLKRGRTTNR